MNHILNAILLVTFFLNILFRFFLVLHAEGLFWKGSLNLKLFKQLYWLLWVALVLLGLIPFAITPIMLGNFPTQNSYRKHLCLGVLVYEKNEKEKGPLGTRIIMAIMVFYVLRFVRKIKSFVQGQCPGGKMCSVGKFRRNVLGLPSTSFVALILQCFFFGLTFVRELTQDLDNSKAFFVNFVVFDSLVYLLAFGVFMFARNDDIPSRKDSAKGVNFYVSKVEVLQPRRPWYFNLPDQVDSLSLQDNFDIQEETTIQVESMMPDQMSDQMPGQMSDQMSNQMSNQMFPNQISRDNSVWTSDSLQLKTCDRFWIRRVQSNNKIHPIVTIYNSKEKAEPKTNETKRKVFSRRESETPQAISENSPSVDSFVFTENPNAIISFHSDDPRVERSEKMKAVQRFSYLTKN